MEKTLKTHALQPLSKAKILRHVYGGVACDPDEKGWPFEIDALPPCEKCGSQKMSLWIFKNPPEIVEVTIPSVAHTRWDTLTDAEKQSLIDAGVLTA